MGVYGVVLTVLVLVAVAVFILLFERRRAEEIERDLRNEPHEPSGLADEREDQD
jgi:hypothetical protein